jgi:hypothetical protein
LHHFGLEGSQTQNHFVSHKSHKYHKLVPVQLIYLLGIASFNFVSHRFSFVMLIYNQRADPHHKQVAEASCGAGTFQIQSGSYRACAGLLGFHHVMVGPVGWFWAVLGRFGRWNLWMWRELRR